MARSHNLGDILQLLRNNFINNQAQREKVGIYIFENVSTKIGKRERPKIKFEDEAMIKGFLDYRFGVGG